MRIVIVRHGDPDYSIDSLTETGWIEAEIVSQRISKLEVRDFYVSPRGRAQDTASLTLKKMGRSAETLDWLTEFDTGIFRPDAPTERRVCWDWLPEDWCSRDAFYSAEHWMEEPEMKEAGIGEKYSWVCRGFDDLMKKYGYVRSGKYYLTEHSNKDTIVLFCHFGVECVIISHIAGISPMPLWQNFCAAPTSVTTILTEERRPGKAALRVSSFGDISHLYAAGREPSFSGRFAEQYGDGDRTD